MSVTEREPADRRGSPAAGKPPRVRMVGAWWGPAVGLSGLGLISAFELDRTDASREVFFNVAQPWAVYVLLAALTGLLVYGFGRHATLWDDRQAHARRPARDPRPDPQRPAARHRPGEGPPRPLRGDHAPLHLFLDHRAHPRHRPGRDRRRHQARLPPRALLPLLLLLRRPLRPDRPHRRRHGPLPPLLRRLPPHPLGRARRGPRHHRRPRPDPRLRLPRRVLPRLQHRAPRLRARGRDPAGGADRLGALVVRLVGARRALGDLRHLADAHPQRPHLVVVGPHRARLRLARPARLHAPRPHDLRARQRLLPAHRRPRPPRPHREHRGAGGLRRRPGPGLHLEAALRARRLRPLRPLHGGLPRRHRRAAALADAPHPGPQGAPRLGRPRPPARRSRRRRRPLRLARRDGRRRHQGRDALGLPHLRRLRRGVPGDDRARPHHRRHAPLPRHGRGPRPRRRPERAREHRAARPPLARHHAHPRVVDGGPGRRSHLRRLPGVPLLGRLLRIARRAQPADHAGRLPAAGRGRRQLRRARPGGDLQRRPGTPARQRVPLPDPRHAARRDLPGQERAEGHHQLPALLQHLPQRVPAVSTANSRSCTTPSSSTAPSRTARSAPATRSARASPTTTPATSAA